MQRSKRNNRISLSRKIERARKLTLIPTVLLLLTLLLSPVAVSAAENVPMLCPGGIPFGIRFSTDGILVVGFCDVTENGITSSPAKDAGLMENDLIRSCNGKRPESAEEFTEAIASSNGKTIELEVKRGEKTLKIPITPRKSDADGKYKSGMWIRDGGAGIGTVTFVSPDSFLFAGLGHGICNGDRGDLVPMSHGTLFSVNVSDVVRGKQGTPGEIKGYFTSEKLGSLIENTELGMFGALTGMPEAMASDERCRAIPIARRDEVTEGKATIYSTLDENGIAEYEIELSEIRRDATAGKCFSVKITDPRLIEKSGGIVQGMSGSPIIQNGKLVGAVTHVLINDPTSGYGIFIENMLAAAEMPMEKAS